MIYLIEYWLDLVLVVLSKLYSDTHDPHMHNHYPKRHYFSETILSLGCNPTHFLTTSLHRRQFWNLEVRAYSHITMEHNYNEFGLSLLTRLPFWIQMNALTRS